MARGKRSGQVPPEVTAVLRRIERQEARGQQLQKEMRRTNRQANRKIGEMRGLSNSFFGLLPMLLNALGDTNAAAREAREAAREAQEVRRQYEQKPKKDRLTTWLVFVFSTVTFVLSLLPALYLLLLEETPWLWVPLLLVTVLSLALWLSNRGRPWTKGIV